MRLQGAAATEQFGYEMAHLLRPTDVIALFGDLGAGKTTFARGLLRGLGYSGEVTSPTFPIVQTYDPPDVLLPVWHVDLYRIEHSSELAELALDEAREAAALIIEWPERLGDLLWKDSLCLHLATFDSNVRALTATVPPAWEGRWPVP
jgi:tRNA threonylcarbamoyladenosine biosynthesis protein TsaE